MPEIEGTTPKPSAAIIQPRPMKHSFKWVAPVPIEDPEQYMMVKGVAIIEGETKRGEVMDSNNIIFGAGAMAAFAYVGQLVIDVDHFDPLPKEYAEKYPGLEAPYPVGYVYDAAAEEAEVDVGDDGKKEKRMAVEFLGFLTNKAAYELVKQNKFTGCSVVEYFRKEMCSCEAGKCLCPREGSKFLRLTFTLAGEPNSWGTWVAPVTKEDMKTILAMPEIVSNAIAVYSTATTTTAATKSVNAKPKSVEDLVKQHENDIAEIKKVVMVIKRRILFMEHVKPISEAVSAHKAIQSLKKEEVNYRPANDSNPCSQCRWFSSWEDVEPGYCALVEGSINHGDTCDRFELPSQIANTDQTPPAPPPVVAAQAIIPPAPADPLAIETTVIISANTNSSSSPPPKPNALIESKPVNNNNNNNNNPTKEKREHNFKEFLDGLPKDGDIPNRVSGEEVKRLLNTVRTELKEDVEEEGNESNN